MWLRTDVSVMSAASGFAPRTIAARDVETSGADVGCGAGFIAHAAANVMVRKMAILFLVTIDILHRGGAG
jgi:hypothetical protein